MISISTEWYYPFDDIKDDEFVEKPEGRWKKYLVRILALLLAITFFLLAFGGVLRLLGMPSLSFLLESRTLSQDPQIKVLIQAVVTIDADNRRGTGFNIDPNGLVITNNHIVEGTDLVHVSFLSGIFQEIHEWIQVPQVDLAIIPLDGQNLPVLELESETLPLKDDAVILIGNPLGFFRVVNRAVVLGYTELESWDIPVLIIKGPVYKGNSGSPVINTDGKVIGVIFATASQADSEEIIAFAIPVSEIIKQVENIDS